MSTTFFLLVFITSFFIFYLEKRWRLFFSNYTRSKLICPTRRTGLQKKKRERQGGDDDSVRQQKGQRKILEFPQSLELNLDLTTYINSFLKKLKLRQRQQFKKKKGLFVWVFKNIYQAYPWRGRRCSSKGNLRSDFGGTEGVGGGIANARELRNAMLRVRYWHRAMFADRPVRIYP